MKVMIFGVTGMVGQGVLSECLSASDVERVVTIGRTRLPQNNPKLHQTICSDLTNADKEIAQLKGYDACFFCLGVSSSGMSEESYRRVTRDLTLWVAEILSMNNPEMTFVYVSGSGTDSSEKGKPMWARVKGETENGLRKMPFASVYCFRPAIIQPLHGIRSKTRSYRIFYRLMGPFFPITRYFFPDSILTTEQIGLAMLNAVRNGYNFSVLEVKDIAALAKGDSSRSNVL